MNKLEELLIIENENEAEKLLKEIIRNDPTNVIACLKLGDIFRHKKYCLDAIKLHKGLLTDESRLSGIAKKKVFVSIIKDYLQANKPKIALQVADELRKIEKEDANLLMFLSTVYEKLEQWEAVIILKQRVLKITNTSDDRGLAILYSMWGETEIKNDNKKEGLKHLREALRLDNFCLPSLLFMGDLYYADGNIDEGIKLWEKILADIPDFAFLAFERLENAYYAKHEIAHLESLYTNFLSQHPEDVRVLLLLAEIYEKKGQDKEALEIIEKAKDIEPQNVAVRTKLLKLYYDTNQYQRVFEEGEAIATIVKYKPLKCYKCNTKFDDFKFKCPICNNWLTIR
ncbi:MAG: tetratricopeptide repeat protein [Candidatus Stahlbacteria bacterium]|nr:tetratricopeptide repeat protein [Candidatus Stahlbacteria bacterium]